MALCVVKVPKDAGGLELFDPRGSRPPFENQRIKMPMHGDIIMFPGWLQHQVQISSVSPAVEKVLAEFMWMC